MTSPITSYASSDTAGKHCLPRILFGADSLRSGRGGISRVARLMARVLTELQQAGKVKLSGVSLADQENPADFDLVMRPARRSKVRFFLSALGGSLSCSHFIYDAASVAQVHAFPLLKRKPSLMFIHGIEVWEHAKAGYIHAVRRTTMLLSNSRFTQEKAERLRGGFSHARVCWLATESDTPPAPATAVDHRPPQVLIVGRLHADRPKGHRELIACWPRVVDKVPEATLHILGDGPDTQSLRALAKSSPAARAIIFHGFVADDQLDAHYAQARVFAMPSRGEGFGLVYVEAMRHGLPVLGSVHDAAGEIILDGRTGYLVDQDRPDELADRLIRLLREPAHAREVGEAGRQRWAQHFRFGAFRERFLPLLQEFLER